MNYRHQFHAGNFADVAKHVLLLELLRSLQQKPKGFLFLDTHAGRGAYDLASAERGDSQERKPEWPEGIGRLWAGTSPEPGLDEYLALVRRCNAERGGLPGELRFYPGSPWLARAVARPQDRLTFCEKHPDEFAALAAAFGGLPRASVQQLDGYVGVRAALPPPERRALVLIDPPYEDQDEFASVVQALRSGLERLPQAVFAVWYPLTERARVDHFWSALLELGLPPTLAAELAVAGEAAGLRMRGCGIAVVNPPWRIEDRLRPVWDRLAAVLSQAAGAEARLRWLVPER